MLCALASHLLLDLRRRRARRSDRKRFHLVADAGGNECIVVDATLAGQRTLFMVDTAYAGAPVVSESFAAVQRKCTWGSVPHRYHRCTALASRDVTDDARNSSVYDELLRTFRCRAFTSGCTMRLMGIGETVENQADMLLCPSIVLDGSRDADADLDADVLVTNPLPGSPHILTMDYLLHRAPCVFFMKEEVMRLRLPASTALVLRHTFQFHEVRLVGGAFSVVVDVGGANMDLVLDTGASTTLSLSSTALAKLRRCSVEEPKSVVQVGVNGERVCSNVLRAPVRVGAIDLGVVDVLANASPVQGSDGYVGMGVLRALDLWFEHARVGVRRSGLPVRSIGQTLPAACPDAANSLASICAS